MLLNGIISKVDMKQSMIKEAKKKKPEADEEDEEAETGNGNGHEETKM